MTETMNVTMHMPFGYSLIFPIDPKNYYNPMASQSSFELTAYCSLFVAGTLFFSTLMAIALEEYFGEMLTAPLATEGLSTKIFIPIFDSLVISIFNLASLPLLIEKKTCTGSLNGYYNAWIMTCGSGLTSVLHDEARLIYDIACSLAGSTTPSQSEEL